MRHQRRNTTTSPPSHETPALFRKPVKLAYYRAIGNVEWTHVFAEFRYVGNWDAGIRTPISRSRVCGPTVGRRPKAEPAQFSRRASKGSRCYLWTGDSYSG